eukprot:TRINITY_DN26975_c0_g1_i1.p2 TRINITY_DN26975_c0_g1~~TRINITY_DN26975_c0_g1_i1.p2  ORF type:complete len:212 (+),score=16.99 TRINITY_DN26975_c0_g1_i1:58-693(+)
MGAWPARQLQQSCDTASLAQIPPERLNGKTVTHIAVSRPPLKCLLLYTADGDCFYLVPGATVSNGLMVQHQYRRNYHLHLQRRAEILNFHFGGRQSITSLYIPKQKDLLSFMCVPCRIVSAAVGPRQCGGANLWLVDMLKLQVQGLWTTSHSLVVWACRYSRRLRMLPPEVVHRMLAFTSLDLPEVLFICGAHSTPESCDLLIPVWVCQLT